MAARLNTKFLLLAVGTVVVAAGLIVALYLLQAGTDASKNIAEGDALMAQGEYNRAYAAYGRAANKEQSNLEYLAKVESALVRIVPQSASEARERFRTYMSILERRTGIAPRDGAGYMPYLELLYSVARIDDTVDAWKRIHDLANQMAVQVDPIDEHYADALLYRGIAGVARLRVLEQREVDQALSDLRRVIELRPGDDRAWAALVRAHQTIADQVAASGRPSAVVQEARDAVQSTLAEAVAAAPEGPRVAEAELDHLIARRTAGDPRITIDRIDAVATRLATNAENVDDPFTLDSVVATLQRTGDRRSNRRASQLAERYNERHPDSLFGLAIQLRAAFFDEDHEVVEQIADQILNRPLPPVGLEAAFQPYARGFAAERQFDIAFNRVEQGPREERAAAMEGAREALEQLRVERASQTTDSAADRSVLKAEGRLLFVEERWSEALARFEQAIRQQGTTITDWEPLFLSASAALRAGDYGLARSRITQAMQMVPRQPNFHALLALIEFAMGNADEARRQIAEAKGLAPDAPYVLETESVIMAGDDEVTQVVRDAQRRVLAGDLEGARRILAEASEEEPVDIRITRLRVRAEAIAGDRTRTAELARAALADHPDDVDLKQLLVIAESPDRLSAVLGAADVMLVDEQTRPMSIYGALRREAQLVRLRSQDRMMRGNETGAAEDAAEADRLDAAADEFFAEAAQQDPPDERYVQAVLDNALRDGDIEAARAIVQREQERSEPIFGSAELVRLQARVTVAEAERIGRTDPARRRAMMAEATEAAIDARNRNPESTELQLLVGELQGFLGNLSASVESYERAYRQRPTDMRVVDLYAGSLHRAGERLRMLEVLREASRRTNVTPTLHDAWLDAEALYGTPRVALLNRRNRWREAPADAANALRLVNLLITLVPSRELAVDARGNERFTESQWRGMSQPAQRQALDTLRRQWMEEATQVSNEIVVTPQNRFQVAGVRAELARRSGDVQRGEDILRNAILEAGDDADAGMWLSLGNYFMNVGRHAAADEAFAEAIQRQGTMREADRVLADIRVSQGRIDDAIGHLRGVLDATPDRVGHLRLVELLHRQGRIEEGQVELDRVVERHGTDAQTLMVQSLLYGSRAVAATGDEANSLRAQQRAALRQAADLNPADPTPLAAEAELIVDLWIRGEMPDPNDPRLNEAVELLDQAMGLSASHWPSVRLKAIILARRGDVGRARAELERLLQVAPSNDDARSMLIELWESSNNLDRAMQVAQDAVDRAPTNSRWLALLGDLRAKAGDRGGAIAAHRRALEVDANRMPERLVMLLMQPDRTGRRDYAAVIQIVEGNREILDRSPYLRAAYGGALAGTGNLERGLEELRLAHAAYQRAIEQNPMAARAIGGWYDQVQTVFSTADRVDQLEQFARSVTDVDRSWPDLQAIGVRWIQSGPSGYSRGIELLERAEQLSGNAPRPLRAQVLLDLGVAYNFIDRCEDAVQVLRESARLDPSNATSLNNLAYLTVTCLGTPDDLREGLNLVQQAIRLMPNVAPFHNTLGTVLSRLGRPAQAEAAFRTSLQISPSADTHIKLATLLSNANRKGEARDELRRAAAIDPQARERADFRALTAELDP